MCSPHYKCNRCNIDRTLWIPLILGVKVLYSICNMSTCCLSDMFTLSPWVCGPQALGVHIRLTTRAHVINTECILYVCMYLLQSSF